MDAPGVLVFAMPFAAPASHKHAAKLVDCLAPACGYLAVVGDRRIDLGGQPPHVVRYGDLPTLHYMRSVRPQVWSWLLWVAKLLTIVLTAAWAVVRLRRRVDVVICFLGAYYAPVLLCARLLGKRTVVYLPNSDAALAAITYEGRAGAGLLVQGLQLLQALNRRLADICTIESAHLMDALGLRPHAAKVRVANLYIDTERYSPQTAFEQRRPLVGFVGRLAAGKGVGALLEAAAALRASGIAFEIVGDGPLRAEVALALQRPDLSHVALADWAEAEVLVERLNRYRLLVLPSDSEGLPNVILEAMACGTPVLATPVGGIPDLIQDQVTGFVLGDSDPQAIARGVRQALADPRLGQIAAQGRQLVAGRYSLRASSETWRQLLRDLS